MKYWLAEHGMGCLDMRGGWHLLHQWRLWETHISNLWQERGCARCGLRQSRARQTW